MDMLISLGGYTATISPDEVLDVHREINACITRLFRISALIRKAAISDPFQKAIQRKVKDEQWSDRHDINHVGKKFPRIVESGDEWLQERLGRAITHRRQYLSYMNDHKLRLAQGAPAEPASSQDGCTAPPPQSENGDTRASTLDPFALEALLSRSSTDVASDQGSVAKSETTMARSIFDHEDCLATHRLPRLSDLLDADRDEVDCPYCTFVGKFSSESSWRRHVYADLRAYVCTFKECKDVYFQDINAWFNHELEAHRSQFRCGMCDSETFPAEDLFLDHVKTNHPILLMGDSGRTLLDISRKPPSHFTANDCAFCSRYESSLPDGEKIPVPKFKRHVGDHLEQLALFALPMPPEVDNVEDYISSSTKEEASTEGMFEVSSEAIHTQNHTASVIAVSDHHSIENVPPAIDTLNIRADGPVQPKGHPTSDSHETRPGGPVSLSLAIVTNYWLTECTSLSSFELMR